MKMTPIAPTCCAPSLYVPVRVEASTRLISLILTIIHVEGIIVIPVLQMRKQRLRETKRLVQKAFTLGSAHLQMVGGNDSM